MKIVTPKEYFHILSYKQLDRIKFLVFRFNFNFGDQDNHPEKKFPRVYIILFIPKDPEIIVIQRENIHLLKKCPLSCNTAFS